MLIKKSRIPIKEIITIGFLPSFLKIFLYKLKGAKIGKKVSIGFGTVIIAGRLEIGDDSSIGFATILRGREIKIGRHVKIGSLVFFDVEKFEIDDDAKINELVFAGGPMLPESYLRLGKRTIVMQLSFLNPTKPLIIGDDTGIGGHCLLFTHGSWQSRLEGYPVTFAPITLGKNVWLPWRIFIMPGVTIENGATIGANSLVMKDVPANSLAAGIPTKILRTPDQYPMKVGQKEKIKMTAKILDEFFRFLKYNNMSIERERADLYQKVVIMTHRKSFWRKKNKKWIFHYRWNTDVDISQWKFSDNTFFLSLPAIREEEIKVIEEKSAMWVDLERKIRSELSNDLGEEAVLFLSRYGLRFDRAKSLKHCNSLRLL